MGRYKEGWEKIEARLELPAVRVTGTYQVAYPHAALSWHAGAAGKTVFVRAEQGLAITSSSCATFRSCASSALDILLESLLSMTTLFHEFLPGVTTVDETDLIPGTVPISILSLPLLRGKGSVGADRAASCAAKTCAVKHASTKIGVCPASTAAYSTPSGSLRWRCSTDWRRNVVSHDGDRHTETCWKRPSCVVQAGVTPVDTAIAHLV